MASKKKGADSTKVSPEEQLSSPAATTDGGELQRESHAATIETRTDLAPVMKTAKSAAERPSDEEIKRRVNTLLGDGYLRAGNVSDALNAYAAAGAEVPTKKLIALGDRLLEQGRLNYAQEAYVAAGAEVPPEKLILLAEKFIARGDQWLAKGNLKRAEEFYAAAGVEIPAEKLIALGDRRLGYGDPYGAQEAYAAAAKLGAETE